MNITRDIINDLLPAYFSGDATADTRRAVDEYFRLDPAFEGEARRAAAALEHLGLPGTAPASTSAEKATLQRAKRALRTQKVLLAVASTLTLNAVSLGFSFEIGNDHVKVHWLALPGQAGLVVTILLASALFWTLYFRTSRRVRTRVLG